MRQFKFFKGHIGTLDAVDGQTYATASIYNPNTYWTPEESERLRIGRMENANHFLARMEQMRNHGIISQEQYNLNRDMFAQQEIIRRQRIDNDNAIRLFQSTTTITVNPTLWTKIKIFGTQVKLFFKECFQQEPIGLIFVTILFCLVSFIGIMKLLGA
jgi:hypothetical protein